MLRRKHYSKRGMNLKCVIRKSPEEPWFEKLHFIMRPPKSLRIGSNRLSKKYISLIFLDPRCLGSQWVDFDDQCTKRKSVSCSTKVCEKSQRHIVLPCRKRGLNWFNKIENSFFGFRFSTSLAGITFRKRHATGLSERSDVQRTRPKVPRTITFMTERLVKLSFGTALNSKIEIKTASKICF